MIRINGRIIIGAFIASALIGAAVLLTTENADGQSRDETDLRALRKQALSLVNQARTTRDRSELHLSEPLNAAAQSHAEDMLQRNYYSHTSPEGDDVRDRFMDQGGSRWKLVAENIATCRGCSVPSDAGRVREFHEGWMQSPGHRRNILQEGLSGFGFGIAGADGTIYAVQTFAGAGTSAGGEEQVREKSLSRDEQSDFALSVLNEKRREAGLSPLQPSDHLAQAALNLQENGSSLNDGRDIYAALPEGRGDWRSINLLQATCGGCGTEPMRSDIRRFLDQWLDGRASQSPLLAESATHFALHLHANGEGRKSAIALVGSHF
ncbi:CAP domain-containing protein [Rhizobium sp. L1K21]|uniref:CAP domain-containing protein n=1 Tax=Rhizobium sp. L1K21 TaxID=2954933 RepID=UPI0020922229|nr:CAP domain-containing protein [Rhizobium sp. L1K21]MCO6187769.1 CAP domain-containing protein [Rhizobium sp. L1K21]